MDLSHKTTGPLTYCSPDRIACTFDANPPSAKNSALWGCSHDSTCVTTPTPVKASCNANAVIANIARRPCFNSASSIARRPQPEGIEAEVVDGPGRVALRIGPAAVDLEGLHHPSQRHHPRKRREEGLQGVSKTTVQNGRHAIAVPQQRRGRQRQEPAARQLGPDPPRGGEHGQPGVLDLRLPHEDEAVGGGGSEAEGVDESRPPASSDPTHPAAASMAIRACLISASSMKTRRSGEAAARPRGSKPTSPASAWRLEKLSSGLPFLLTPLPYSDCNAIAHVSMGTVGGDDEEGGKAQLNTS